MKIAIVEDSAEACELLQTSLESFAKEVHDVFQIDAYANGFNFLEAFHAWKASGTPTSSLTIASKIVYGEKNKRSSDDKTATNVFEDVSTQFKDSKTSGSPLNFSRKDFAGTYPTAPSDEDKAANSAIVDASKLFDVATDKTLGNTATSKVYTTTAPTTKASVPFNAIALRGLAYDDPAYSALLDSMVAIS